MKQDAIDKEFEIQRTNARRQQSSSRRPFAMSSVGSGGSGNIISELPAATPAIAAPCNAFASRVPAANIKGKPVEFKTKREPVDYKGQCWAAFTRGCLLTLFPAVCICIANMYCSPILAPVDRASRSIPKPKVERLETKTKEAPEQIDSMQAALE